MQAPCPLKGPMGSILIQLKKKILLNSSYCLMFGATVFILCEPGESPCCSGTFQKDAVGLGWSWFGRGHWEGCASVHDGLRMFRGGVLCSELALSKLAEQTSAAVQFLSDLERTNANICHVHSDITVGQLRERNLIFLAITFALGIPSWLIVHKAEK